MGIASEGKILLPSPGNGGTVTPPPWSDSFLFDASVAVLRAVLFTVGAWLVVLVGALLLRAILVAAGPRPETTPVASLLALVAFVLYLAVPTYLLVVRTNDGGDDDDDGNGEGL